MPTRPAGCDIGAGIRMSATEHPPDLFRGVLRRSIDALQIPQLRVLFDVDSINCRNALTLSGSVFR